MLRFLLFLSLLGTSPALAEIAPLPGEPPPLTGQLAEREVPKRRSNILLSLERGGSDYMGIGLDSTIGVSSKAAILLGLGLTQLGDDDKTIETSPGIDIFLSDALDLRFNALIRRYRTNYDGPETDYSALGGHASFDWTISHTSLSFGAGAVNYYNSSVSITQITFLLGVAQEIGDVVRLGVNYSGNFYSPFPLLKDVTIRDIEIITAFPARTIAGSLAVRPFSAGAFVLRAYFSPARSVRAPSVSQGASLTFQGNRFSAGVSIAVVTAKSGDRQTSRGIQLGYVW